MCTHIKFIHHVVVWIKNTYFKPVVRPAAKLHVALLVVKGEPGDVDLAGGLEDPGRDLGAGPVAPDHHVGGVGTVECFARTKNA